MAFKKRTYVARETVITAENLNDIQDAILGFDGVVDTDDSDPDYTLGVDENGIFFKEKEKDNNG